MIEAQSYICGNAMLHRFSAFQDEVAADLPANTDYDKLDTIVVPAREDGFQDVFIGENQWYAIRISTAMLDKIKYIATYQVAPVSAITHVAIVKMIDKYQNTGKYILYFEASCSRRLK